MYRICSYGSGRRETLLMPLVSCALYLSIKIHDTALVHIYPPAILVLTFYALQ